MRLSPLFFEQQPMDLNASDSVYPATWILSFLLKIEPKASKFGQPLLLTKRHFSFSISLLLKVYRNFVFRYTLDHTRQPQGADHDDSNIARLFRRP